MPERMFRVPSSPKSTVKRRSFSESTFFSHCVTMPMRRSSLEKSSMDINGFIGSILSHCLSSKLDHYNGILDCMTGRTHDLAAFTALTVVMATEPLHKMTFATALVAFSANMIGGLAPDIDQPTAALWRRMRAGSVIGRLVQPLLGGHRLISHSIIGLFLFGIFTRFLLDQMKAVLIVDMNVVWWSFMIGFVSHLIADTFTKEGVPWLFPIPFSFGFPPFRFMRFKAGGLVEKSFVFPMLLITNIVLFYYNYEKFLEFVKKYIVK